MRYLPLTPEDRAAMLNTIGAASVDDFYEDVPESARLKGPIRDLPNHQGELAVERHLARLAAHGFQAEVFHQPDRSAGIESRDMFPPDQRDHVPEPAFVLDDQPPAVVALLKGHAV